MTKKDIIYKNLKREIIKGNYKEGDLLLSEYDICEKYNVSREPVRRAIAKLREKGYVTTKRGKGNIINPKEYYLHQSISSISEEENQVKDITVIKLSKIENNGLFDNEEFCFYYERIIKTEDNTIFEKAYLPYNRFEDFDLISCQNSVLDYIKHKKNIKISLLKKKFDSILVKLEDVINEYIEKPIENSIRIEQHLYDEDHKLIQLSIQVKENSTFTYVTNNE